MKYNCSFPNCGHSTNDRSLIHKHHIVPKEVDPRPQNKVTIDLCPTCHHKIYVKESESGIHSKLKKESLIIKNKLKYGNDDVIMYLNPHTNEEFLYDPVNKVII